MRLFTVVSLFVTILLVHKVSAQPNPDIPGEIAKKEPQVQRLSPNAASLGKFGDYPVSLYTGLPEINIPIFEAKSGSLSLPITLSYHASGIKYAEKASWVGLGWSLSVGGQITRQIRGKADEEYYYNSTLPSNGNACENYYFISDLVSGSKDAEPDQFSYSYPGKSGRFILGQGPAGVPRDYLTIPYEPIKIYDEDFSAGFNKFEILDEQGNLYRYGKNSSNVISFENTINENNQPVASAWNLMEMIAPNSDDKISISYQLVGPSSSDDHVKSISIVDNVHNLNPALEPDVHNGDQNTVNKLINTKVDQLGPETILFEGGKVVFTLGAVTNEPNFHRLDHISVYAQIGNSYFLKKEIQFVYTYFKNSAQTADLRLKLDAIEIKSNDNVKIQKYNFEYFTNKLSWNSVDSSPARDVWGYYNGATGNADLIPRQSFTIFGVAGGNNDVVFIGGATNREANLSFTREAVLKKITFPTGGYTEFDFELHQYIDDDDHNIVKTAGGLRVASIKSYDGTGADPIIKTYKYGLNEVGYGHKNFFNDLYFYSSHLDVRHLHDDNGGSTQYTYRTTTFFSTPTTGLYAAEGSAVVYPNVTEYYGTPAISGPGGSAENSIGKIVYQFDEGGYERDVLQGTANSSKKYINSMAWKRGHLTKKSVYIKGSVNPISETTTKYNTIHGFRKMVGYGAARRTLYSADYGANLFLQNCNTPSVDAIEYGPMTEYDQGTGVMKDTAQIERIYDQVEATRFAETISTKLWDENFIQVARTTTSTSESGSRIVTKFKYPYSYTYSGTEVGNAQALRLMRDRNQISVPVEQYTLREGVGVISGQIITFAQNQSNSNYLVPDKVYFLETKVPLSEPLNYTSLGGNNLIVDSKFKQRISPTFNTQGDLKEIAKIDGQSLSSDAPTSFLYGYGNTLPILKALNALSTEVFIQNFEDLAISSQVARNSSAHSGDQYWTGGNFQTAFVKPNSRDYFIDYWFLDGSSKWNYVRKPYTNNMILNESASFDDIRIYPSDADVTSHTYDPVNGMTSTEDTNGRTIFYQYDAFGRLSAIMDTDKNIVKAYKYHYSSQD